MGFLSICVGSNLLGVPNILGLLHRNFQRCLREGQAVTITVPTTSPLIWILRGHGLKVNMCVRYLLRGPGAQIFDIIEGNRGW